MTFSLACPFCCNRNSRVVESRAVVERGMLRRRRECLGCHERWTTYEVDGDRLSLLEDAMKQKKDPAR